MHQNPGKHYSKWLDEKVGQQFTKNFDRSKYWNRKKMFKERHWKRIFESIDLKDECGKRKLLHLRSDVSLPDEITDEIWILFVKGKVYTSYFEMKGSLSCEELFHATLRKNNFMSFSKMSA